MVLIDKSNTDSFSIVDGYFVHTYTTAGNKTIDITDGGEVEILVVAGGGAGANASDRYLAGGGGGGGEVVHLSSFEVPPGRLSLTIGAGGAAANGGNSVFGSIQTNGGGRGGRAGHFNPNSGGSGGGCGRNQTVAATSVKLHPNGMGNAGGVSIAGVVGAAGGGGASQVGANVINDYGAAGGQGYTCSISGTSQVYGSGGGGGARGGGDSAGGDGGTNAGKGGGGETLVATGTNAVNGFGGGGGGGGSYGESTTTGFAVGGLGGSGVIIVRYLPTSVMNTRFEPVGATAPVSFSKLRKAFNMPGNQTAVSASDLRQFSKSSSSSVKPTGAISFASVRSVVNAHSPVFVLDAHTHTAGSSNWVDATGAGIDFIINPSAHHVSAGGVKYMDFEGSYGTAKREGVSTSLSTFPPTMTAETTAADIGNYVATNRYTANNDPSLYGGWKVFDGDNNTAAWGYGSHYSGATGIAIHENWVLLQLPKTVRVSSYTVYLIQEIGCPAGWVLEGSNDNTNYTTIDTITNATISATPGNQTFTVSGTPGLYLYLRFRVSKVYVTGTDAGFYMRSLSYSAYGMTLAETPTSTDRTMIVFSSLKNNTTQWRTLLRGATADHHVLINRAGITHGGGTADVIGSYKNTTPPFTPFALNINDIPSVYDSLNMLVFKFSHNNPYFSMKVNNQSGQNYIQVDNVNARIPQGTAVIGGWHHNSLVPNTSSQYWGKVGMVLQHDRHLTESEIGDIYNRYAPRFVYYWPPVTSGLVGYYNGESWTGTQWTDLSGAGNHAVTVRGTINVHTTPLADSGGTVYQGLNGFKYLGGNVDAGIRFPVGILPSANFTLFFVARYSGLGARGRIFDAVNANILFGFWGGRSGVYYYFAWQTGGLDVHGNNWVIASFTRNSMRSNFTSRKIADAGGVVVPQLSINHGATAEFSDWLCGTVIVYNRELSNKERLSVEHWLAEKYNIRNTATAATHPLYLLDKTSVAAKAACRGAYDIKRVSTTYDGPVLKLRRSSDNSERDFYADSEGNLSLYPNDFVTHAIPPRTFPPNMTADTTNVYDQSNRNGTYVASVSAIYAGDSIAFNAFDGSLSTNWHSALTYNATTGAYIGSVQTTTETGVVYAGEWLQIQLPQKIKPLSYSVYPRIDLYSQRSPNTFYILGSTSSTTGTWVVLASESNVTWAAATQTFYVNPIDDEGYNYLRLVTTVVGSAGSRNSVQIADWRITEMPQTPLQKWLSSPVSLKAPPLMTANTTAFTDKGALNGSYVASASTQFVWGGNTDYAFNAFNAINHSSAGVGNNWHSVTSYTASTGIHNNTQSTVDNTAATYYGEWLQLQMPAYFDVVSYTMLPRQNEYFNRRSPSSFKLFGSTTGVSGSWVVLDTRTNISWTSETVALTFTLAATAKYLYYRLATNIVGNPDQTSARDSVQIADLRFNLASYIGRTLPPPLTANTTVVSNYGENRNGTYVVRQSSALNSSSNGKYVFDADSSTLWHSLTNYNTTTGAYNFSPPSVTTLTNGTAYSGDWVDLQFPTPIRIKSYTITPHDFVYLGINNSESRSPHTFYLVGTMTGDLVQMSYTDVTYNLHLGGVEPDALPLWKNNANNNLLFDRFAIGDIIVRNSINFVITGFARDVLPQGSGVLQNWIYVTPNPQGSFNSHSSDNSFVGLSGRANNTWNLIDSRVGINNWTTASKTFTVSSTNTQSYLYYRLVVTVVGNQAYDTRNSLLISELSFTEAPMAHVSTWYDQSGNDRHAVQTVLANQPEYGCDGRYVDFKTTSDRNFIIPSGTLPVGVLNAPYSIVANHGVQNGYYPTLISAGVNVNNQANVLRLNNTAYLNYWWGNDMPFGTTKTGNTVAVTYDGTNRKGYVNGVLQGTQASTGTNVTAGNQYIGSSTNGFDFFNSRMYNIIVFGSALDEADVKVLGGTRGNVMLTGLWHSSLYYNRVLGGQASEPFYVLDTNSPDARIYGKADTQMLSLPSTTVHETAQDHTWLVLTKDPIRVSQEITPMGETNQGLEYTMEIATQTSFSIDMMLYATGTDTNSVFYQLDSGSIVSFGVQTLEYPPAALTGDSTALTNTTYAAGTYVTSQSTVQWAAVPAWKAFNKTNLGEAPDYDDCWHSAVDLYNTTTGLYVGAASTGGYLGEWLQIQMPESMIVKTFTVACRNLQHANGINAGPVDFRLYGSMDGTTWTQVHEVLGAVWTTAAESKTYTVNNTVTYTYFRIAVNKNGATISHVAIGELYLYGIPFNKWHNIVTSTLTAGRHSFRLWRQAALGLCGVRFGSYVTTTGLAMWLDPTNPASYSGTGTTLTDLSGNNRHGTLVGGALVNAQKHIVINGTGQYISTTYLPNLDSLRPYTFELWFWDDVPGITDSTNTALISNISTAGSTSYAFMHIQHDGKIWSGEVNATASALMTSPASICTGTWTHVVKTADATNQRIYINGVQVTSASRPGGVITSNMSLVIGGHHYSRYQTCCLGPVRIYYDKALTATEVVTHYNAERQLVSHMFGNDARNIESGQWNVMYELTNPRRDVSGNLQYTQNNVANLQGNIGTRVAYYMQNKMQNGATTYWVYISMDAYSSTLTDYRIPDASNTFVNHRNVTNINVYSNHPQVGNYSVAQGRVALWYWNYSPATTFGDGSASLYDIDDTPTIGGESPSGGGHGTVMIHDITNKKTLLSWNMHRHESFVVNQSIGIGNNDATNIHHVAGQPNWTGDPSNAFNWKLQVLMKSP